MLEISEPGLYLQDVDTADDLRQDQVEFVREDSVAVHDAENNHEPVAETHAEISEGHLEGYQESVVVFHEEIAQNQVVD